MCCYCFPQCKNICVCFVQNGIPFLIIFYLIFVCKLFSPGQLQWLLPAMEVSELQHPTKSSLRCSDDGLIPEKSKAEVYLGSMESKHTTKFTRKKHAKKINRFVYILTNFGIGSLVIIIYIGHYFLPITYVIFILWYIGRVTSMVYRPCDLYDMVRDLWYIDRVTSMIWYIGRVTSMKAIQAPVN